MRVMRFIKENYPIILGIVFLAFLLVLVFASKNTSTQNYQECKSKTQDLEWCFKIFEPRL